MSESKDPVTLSEHPHLVDYALDGTKVGFDLTDRLNYLDEQIMIYKKRTVIEYYRIYLTTLSDFKQVFNQHVTELPKGYTRIDWNKFLQMLPFKFKEENQDLFYLITGNLYSDLCCEVHNIKSFELARFIETMKDAEDEPDKDAWLKLANLINANIAAIQARKEELKKERRI